MKTEANVPEKRKRGRSRKDPMKPRTDLKSLGELFGRKTLKCEIYTAPVRTTKHELSKVLKDVRKDYFRAQRKKLVDMLMVNINSEKFCLWHFCNKIEFADERV